jgi:hypothetical protein
MSLWTSLTFLTWPISVMAEILLGFATMPRLVLMYPRSLPRGTPKVHFSGLNLTLKCLRLAKVYSRLAMILLLYRVFTMMMSM